MKKVKYGGESEEEREGGREEDNEGEMGERDTRENRVAILKK